MKQRIYIAYGSNMSEVQMEDGVLTPFFQGRAESGAMNSSSKVL